VRRLRARTPWVLLIAVAILAGAAACAFAYWGGPGSGTATTVLANTESLSFEPGVPTAQLYPGGDTGVAIVAVNPNPYFVEVGTISLDTDEGVGGFDVGSAHSGCDLSALSFVPQDNGGTGWEIPPRAGTTDGRLTIDMASALLMTTSASDACQGATFTVHLEATP
jgi:hypothetical protein